MMEDFMPFYKKASFWRFVIVWGSFLLFLFFFRDDLAPAWQGWRSLFLRVLDYIFILLGDMPRPAIELNGVNDANWYAMLRIAVNILIFCGVYLASLFIIAQFILPVHTWQERMMAWKRLLLYLIGWHGPAVFVREGKLVSQTGEVDSVNPGVALVDLRSALVLEQTNPWGFEKETGGESIYVPPRTKSPFWFHGDRVPQEGPYPLTRICGPGINFTEWGEKIRNEIDLRPQIRLESDVKAFTRDGIEIETKVFVGFSVSSPPDVIPVAYIGGSSVENLFGLILEDKSPGVIAITGKFNLDPQDAWEIHRFVTSNRQEFRVSAPAVASADRSLKRGPFTFDEQRIFSAAYGQAYRDGSSGAKTEWHELPLLVAVEIFREHLGQYTYDHLYMFDNPDRLPWLAEIKPEFMRKIKHQGLLSFKLVRFAGSNPNQTASQARWNFEPIDEKSFGQAIRASSLEISPPYLFQNTHSKPLREHGVAILFAGFAELKPPSAIKVKMMERWKAKLELEIKTVLARNEREAMQVINSARTQSQRDATYSLSNLLRQEKHSKEALALLLFQSLQVAATDEKNHKDLPPREILGMMQNLHRWLLVEWEESDAKKRGPKDGKQSPPASDR